MKAAPFALRGWLLISGVSNTNSKNEKPPPEGRRSSFPVIQQPGFSCNALAPGDKMQIVAAQKEDGTYTVLLHFWLQEAVSRMEAEAITPGVLMQLLYRHDFHGAKKAFQQVLQQTAGWKLLFAKVEEKVAPDVQQGVCVG